MREAHPLGALAEWRVAVAVIIVDWRQKALMTGGFPVPSLAGCRKDRGRMNKETALWRVAFDAWRAQRDGVEAIALRREKRLAELIA
jgi:hypothetical protein